MFLSHADGSVRLCKAGLRLGAAAAALLAPSMVIAQDEDSAAAEGQAEPAPGNTTAT